MDVCSLHKGWASLQCSPMGSGKLTVSYMVRINYIREAVGFDFLKYMRRRKKVNVRQRKFPVARGFSDKESRDT